jgi:sulfhydrogenase subunit beta (sulfur reductase)
VRRPIKLRWRVAPAPLVLWHEATGKVSPVPRPADATSTSGRAGALVIVDVDGLDELVARLRALGYEVKGPTLHDGAIVPGPLTSCADLPRGAHDLQAPGHYSIVTGDDDGLFSWAVGPGSWKQEFFPSSQLLWRGEVAGDTVVFKAPEPPSSPLAVVGARPCDVAAIAIVDRVLKDGSHRDPRYGDRRDSVFIAVVECASPADTCFCASMHSGPGIEEGFDLALTELNDEKGHRFVVRSGTPRGTEVLSSVPTRPASELDLAARSRVLDDASRMMKRSLPFDEVASLLARNVEHPRWDDVAQRCLSCANCTMICPTCFCSDVRDTSELSGALERRRTWSSCFDLEHSYLHGGAVHASSKSRYRQWMTHKLSTWWDQFDSTGCVGCGRCIVWCPVGIDITQEVTAIAASDVAPPLTSASRSEP